MKKFFSCGLYLILALIMIGCAKSPQSKFDRIKAFNNNSVDLTPYARYIKKQKIITEEQGKRLSVNVFENSNTGDYLKSQLNYLDPQFEILNTSQEFDLDNNKFNLLLPILQIKITGGTIIRDENNEIVRLIGVNDQTIFDNKYQYGSTYFIQNGKIIRTVSVGNKAIWETNITWDGDLPTKEETKVTVNGKIIVRMINYFFYNHKGQLIKEEHDIINSENISNVYEIFYTEYNQYGDWIKALKYSKDQISVEPKVTITREIEYW